MAAVEQQRRQVVARGESPQLSPGRCRIGRAPKAAASGRNQVHTSTITMFRSMELIHELEPSDMSHPKAVSRSGGHFYEREPHRPGRAH